MLSLSFPATEIANDRRRALIAEADAYRLARAAAQSRTPRSDRRPIRLVGLMALVRRRGSGGAACRRGVRGGVVAG